MHPFANQKGYSPCTVVIPLPTFVSCSFLTDQVGEDLQWVWHGFSEIVGCTGTADIIKLFVRSGMK